MLAKLSQIFIDFGVYCEDPVISEYSFKKIRREQMGLSCVHIGMPTFLSVSEEERKSGNVFSSSV